MHQRIADEMRALLTRYRSTIAEPFLREWPGTNQPVARAASSLPVLAWLPQLSCDVSEHTAALAGLVAGSGDDLDWRQTYGAGDFGSGFLQRYGWTEIIGQRGVIASDLIAAGFLLLGPEVEYPFHSHDAEEIYIPLSGAALWAAGSQGWCERLPGELIHHPPRVPHAMKTSTRPLLALYLWRAGNLTQKSVIEFRDN